MIAFLFTLALFFFWGLVGFATISLFSPRLRIVQGILISPAVGIAVVLLSFCFINRAGSPVKNFGSILFISLALMSTLVLAIKRPLFPFKRMWPFFIVAILALILTANPLFKYGFDWVSFSNDDMANYCLGAQRLLNQGFFDPLNLNAFFAGKDYSQAIWFVHVAHSARFGSELILAAVWSLSGLDAHQIFMPVIMALHLALIFSAAALTAGYAQGRNISLIAAGLMMISPLTTLGTLYQLIGQVGGLALLCACAVLFFRPLMMKSKTKLIADSIISALLFAALMVWYPEVLPFFGLGWALYLVCAVNASRSLTQAFRIIIPAALVGFITLVILRGYVISAIQFLLGQASEGVKSADLSSVLFPYFLIPSGIPALWGLIPIAANTNDLVVSVAILAGLPLLIWFSLRLIARIWARPSAAACIGLVMLSVGVLLFIRNNDFGLFKLAMYFQPFLLAVLALEVGDTIKGGFGQKLFVLLLGLGAIPSFLTQANYVDRSTGERFGSLTEIPHASLEKVNTQFQALSEELKGRSMILETPHIVLAKFEALYTIGRPALFPSRPFLIGLIDGEIVKIAPKDRANHPEIAEYERLKAKNILNFSLADSISGNRFAIPVQLLNQTDESISIASKGEIFNRYNSEGNSTSYFSITNTKLNHLMFVHSELGNHYYLADAGQKIAYFQTEQDPLFSGREFTALGQHLLFLVRRSTSHPRAVMELTATVAKQFGSKLPDPIIQNVPVGFVGRGTGRVFSKPLEISTIQGLDFISIDMQRRGLPFPDPKHGLMLLYGRNIPADRRLITSFGRDISLVSEEQYQSIRAPAAVQKFPEDLANKNLEYSGVYEDGWISEKAFFVLRPTNTDAGYLVIKGTVPLVDNPKFATVLNVVIADRVVQKQLGLGAFNIKIPVIGLSERQRIDLSFTESQTLPGNDGRVTGGKIDFIGFVDGGDKN